MIAIYESDAYFRSDLLERIELKTLDYRFLWRGIEEPDDRIVILGIDERALDMIRDPMIFWRTHFAKVIKKLAKGGAKAVGLDFVFALALKKSIDGLDYDKIMATALKEADNVILVKTFRREKDTNEYTVDEPIPRLRYAANSNYSGFANVPSDPDNCVRRQTLLIKDKNGKGHLAFGLAILAKYFDYLGKVDISARDRSVVMGDKTIPVNKYGEMVTNYAGPNGTFNHISFYDAWKKADEEDSDTYFKENFGNKMVLIGTTNILHQDFKPTPFFGSEHYFEIRQTYGIEIWANVINTILKNNYIYRLPDWQVILIILFLGLVVSFIALRFSLVTSSIMIASLGVGYMFFCVLIFVNYDIWVSIVAPIFTMPLTYAVIFAYRFTLESKQRAVVKNLFQYYLHPSVVNELLKNPEGVKLGGVKKDLTIFFSDVQDFTTISESMPPERLVDLINEYLTEMSEYIIKYEGTIDKYEGDALMAFFGAPVDLEKHALLACCAAIDSQRHLVLLRQKFKEKGWPEIYARIGINTGNVVVGNMGGKNRFDYTVLGDDVNLASRLEGLNKIYSTNIMIGGNTYDLAKDNIVARELDLVRVKGKNKPVRVYELISRANEADDKTLHFIQNFHDGLKAYRNRDWVKGIDFFNNASKIVPGDRASDLYIGRCNEFIITPPPDDWDNVYNRRGVADRRS